jgi:hypothetical protein
MKKEVDFGSLEVEGIDTRDYPDFCDAYISGGCFIDGTPLDDDILFELNENGGLVHEMVWKHLY